jgi:hypothetical protein
MSLFFCRKSNCGDGSAQSRDLAEDGWGRPAQLGLKEGVGEVTLKDWRLEALMARLRTSANENAATRLGLRTWGTMILHSMKRHFEHR